MKMPRLLLMTLAALLLATSSAHSQSGFVDSQKRLIEAIKKQIEAGEKQLSSIRKDKSSNESRVRSLASQVEQRNRLLDAQNMQINLLKVEIESCNEREEELNAQLEEERGAYAKMVRDSYRNYRHNNFVSYIFASDDFNDVARRIVNIRHVAKIREQRIASIDSLATDLDSTRQLLLSRKASLDSVANDIVQQRGSLQRDIDAARVNIKAMSAKEKSALQANALQQQKLSTAIEELRRASKGNLEGVSFNSSTSKLNLPVVGGSVKRYMDNMAEVIGGEGAAVISIYEGKVVDVRQNRITGKYDIYVAHGEYISSYAGLRSVAVAKGDVVKKSQRIGVVGASVDIITMASEHKIIFGIYPPSPTEKMKASDCFKK